MEFLKNNKVMNWGIFALVTLVLFYIFGTRSGKARLAAATGRAYENETVKGALTYELSQYATMADRLESAMFGITDDEESIYAVFSKLRNKSDLLQLITSFGNRRPAFYFGKAGLPTWINMRLSKSEIQKVQEILTRNSIDFQF